MENYNEVNVGTISLKPRLEKKEKKLIYLLSIRHADIPESCVRYVGAMVDDVIKTGSEVNAKSLRLID